MFCEDYAAWERNEVTEKFRWCNGHFESINVSRRSALCRCRTLWLLEVRFCDQIINNTELTTTGTVNIVDYYWLFFLQTSMWVTKVMYFCCVSDVSVVSKWCVNVVFLIQHFTHPIYIHNTYQHNPFTITNSTHTTQHITFTTLIRHLQCFVIDCGMWNL